jgi:quercetin dioxygenase-like cupin family protein
VTPGAAESSTVIEFAVPGGHMKLSRILIVTALVPLLHAQSRTTEKPSWAPKPVAMTKYVAPHKPHTKLADVKAKHKGEANWREQVVQDDVLDGAYVFAAPGSKVSPRFHPDNRAWWVVIEGSIRFNIEGQDSFVATKGSMVQVPMQTIFSLETLGDQPSLRWEVNIAKSQTLFPGTEQPPTVPGTKYVSVTLNRKPGELGHQNKPHINLFELAKQPNYSGGRFVHDDRGVANIIYGYEKNLRPVTPADNGHYHPESSEFWLIMTGQISYKVEGQPFIVANEGDVVYVPVNTFHLARFHGDGPSCRLAMNGYPNIAHLYEAH